MAVTWCTTADVAAALGAGAPTAPADMAWLDQATAAGNEQVYAERARHGYTDDPASAPDASCKLAAVEASLEEYRRRGAIADTAITYTADGQPIMAGWTHIRRLLGCPRPAFGWTPPDQVTP
jgi:hypothetical protein